MIAVSCITMLFALCLAGLLLLTRDVLIRTNTAPGWLLSLRLYDLGLASLAFAAFTLVGGMVLIEVKLPLELHVSLSLLIGFLMAITVYAVAQWARMGVRIQSKNGS